MKNASVRFWHPFLSSIMVNKMQETKSCANDDCYRWAQLGSGSHHANRTQTDYCSLYCRLYAEQGLTKVIKPDKLGRKNKSFPQITINCDACGADLELHWNEQDCNRAFCNRKCHLSLKTDKSVRKPELRYAILRLMRDHPVEQWNVKELARMLDQSYTRWRVNSAVVSQLLRTMKTSVERIEPCVYKLKPEAYHGPLMRFITKSGA